ncbi:hypothetical protein A3L12_00130 [Thermococcus sp. P6]|nr:hypothetical protein A3L12_00130 [Thermococcus sp. P6]
MSARLRFSLILGVLLSLMTLMMDYSAATSEIPRGGEASWAGVLLMVLATAGLLIILGLFLGWRDPFRRDEGFAIDFRSYLTIIAAGVIVVLLLRLIVAFPGEIKKTISNYSTTGLHHLTVPTVPRNVTESAGRSMSQVYVPYALLLAAVVVFIYLAFIQYRGYLRRKEKVEIKLKAELFDRKLDDLGLDAFKDPGEAVIGIYRNAVLWLDYLGIPYEESWTHWEHASRVGYMRDAFVELTGLFEKAKYAPERVSWKDAEKALEAYLTMRRGVHEG